MQTTKTTKRGRPETPVVWPEGEFTAEQAFVKNQNKVSRVSIHNKINQAVSLGDLVKTKKNKAKIGRPSFLYTLTGAELKQDAEEYNF